jgi:hypothetical protein
MKYTPSSKVEAFIIMDKYIDIHYVLKKEFNVLLFSVDLSTHSVNIQLNH